MKSLVESILDNEFTDKADNAAQDMISFRDEANKVRQLVLDIVSEQYRCTEHKKSVHADIKHKPTKELVGVYTYEFGATYTKLGDVNSAMRKIYSEIQVAKNKYSYSKGLIPFEIVTYSNPTEIQLRVRKNNSSYPICNIKAAVPFRGRKRSEFVVHIIVQNFDKI